MEQAAWNRQVNWVNADDLAHTMYPFMRELISRLASRGIVYTNAYCATSVCGPDRGSQLTGRYSHNTGLTKTIGAWQQFRDRGWDQNQLTKWIETFAPEVAIFGGGKILNDIQGPDTRLPGIPKETWRVQLEDLNDPDFVHVAVNGERRSIPRGGAAGGNESMILGEFAVDFKRRYADRPHVLLAWPHAPHEPSFPRSRYSDLHIKNPDRASAAFNEQDLSDKGAAVRAKAHQRTNTERDQAATGMYREVLEVDDLIAMIDDASNAETWWIVSSDNGFNYGANDLDKKLWPYDEANRVPLVIVPPASLGVAPRVDDRLVGQVDLAPTICGILGVPYPADIDGRSILPSIVDPSAPQRTHLLSENTGETSRAYFSVRSREFVEGRGYTDTLYVDWPNDDWPEEIYDYALDPALTDGTPATPYEQQIMPQRAELSKAMRVASGDQLRELEAWR